MEHDHEQALQRDHQRRRPRLDSGLDSVHRGVGAGGRAERPDRPLRRHGARGVVSLRRPHRHADDAAARGRGPHLHAVAHHRAVLPHPVVPPHRTQPPPERLRLHLRGGHGLPRVERPHPDGERLPGPGAPRARLQHVLDRQEPQRPVRLVGDGLVEGGVAHRPGLRPLLRLHRRRDEPVVSRPRRGQPLRRPALPARGRLPRVEGLRRQGHLLHRRQQAVASRQALVHEVLPGGQPRAPPLAPRTTSTSTRARSTTATRPTASGCSPG